MRRFLGVFALVVCGVMTARAADSDEAIKTRDERLKTKVNVEWKNLQFRDALGELVLMIDEKGLGKIDIKYNTGVSMNTRVTFSAKDKTVAEVLDGMLGKDLGYVVISKKGDKSDGGLLIRQGNERGTAAEESKTGKTTAKDKPKDKPDAKPKDKPEPKAKPEPKEKPESTADDKEKQAASKLDLIKMLVDSGKKDKAKERLEELVKSFPDTKAASEAKELLEKLK